MPVRRIPELRKILSKRIVLTGLAAAAATGLLGPLEKYSPYGENGIVSRLVGETYSAISFIDSPDMVSILILLAILSHFMFIHEDNDSAKHYLELARQWFVYGSIVTTAILFFPEIPYLTLVDDGFDIPFVFMGIMYLYYGLLISGPGNFLKLIYIHRIFSILDERFLSAEGIMSVLGRENPVTLKRNFLQIDQDEFDRFIKEEMMKRNPDLFKESRMGGFPRNPMKIWLPYLINWDSRKNKGFQDFFVDKVLPDWGPASRALKIDMSFLSSLLDELEQAEAITWRIARAEKEYALKETAFGRIKKEILRIFSEHPLISEDAFSVEFHRKSCYKYRECDVSKVLKEMKDISKIGIARKSKRLLKTKSKHITYLAYKSNICDLVLNWDWNYVERRISLGLERAIQIRYWYDKEELLELYEMSRNWII